MPEENGRTKKCTRVADRAFPEVKVAWRQPGDFGRYADSQMELDEYWALIGSIDTETLQYDQTAALKPLLDELKRLSKDELRLFYEHMVKRLYRLNRIEIREKCEFGNSGEGFLYHRLYVIAMGREYYSDFLKHPQHLQNMFDSMLYCLEGFDDVCLENDIGTNNPEPTE